METVRNIKCNRCKSYRTEVDFLKEGRKMKTCALCRERGRISRIKNLCEHQRLKCQCKDCVGVSICEHQRRKNTCKECGCPKKVTIIEWILNSRRCDKKYGRYDADRFIDKCFLKGLVEDYENCYYSDCNVKLQYVHFQDDLATIERLNNNIGHVKSNCVLACLKCNNLKKSNNK